MFRFLITYSILFVALVTNLRALEATESTQISLLTVSPGQESYTAHGHSAIRVKDVTRDFDWAFNYGTFDFQTEGFVMKFIKGKLPYFLSVDPYRNFEYVYDREHRSIYEQSLNLTLEQKQVFLDFLSENAKPENKYYLYDFLYDNCSSRIRDIIESQYESGEFPSISSETVSFRELIDRNLLQGEWCDFGIDLLLGSPIDIKASERHRMFLPYELMAGFDRATIDGQPLVSETKTILEHGELPYTEHFWVKPALLFWIILICSLITFIYLPAKVSKTISWFILLLLGLAGIFLVFMWFGTDHLGTKWNLNVLWANPLYLVVCFGSLFFSSKPNTYYFLNGLRWFLILFLISWLIIPQEFHIAVLPLTLMATLSLSVLIKRPVNAVNVSV